MTMLLIRQIVFLLFCVCSTSLFGAARMFIGEATVAELKSAGQPKVLAALQVTSEEHISLPSHGPDKSLLFASTPFILSSPSTFYVLSATEPQPQDKKSHRLRSSGTSPPL